MKYAVLDCETTIKNNGNPFTKSNKLCLVGIKAQGVYTEFDIEYNDEPYGEALKAIQSLLESVDLVVGYNIKFDLQWIKRYVPNLSVRCVFDSQLGDFLLSSQRHPYPSLDYSLARRGMDLKLDTVKREYWDHGIDTDHVPRDVLSAYLQQDVDVTEKLFLRQIEELTRPQKKLLHLQFQDLLILMEMERNGLQYDAEKAAELGGEVRKEIEEIDAKLKAIVGHNCINFGSDDHISCLLYGGDIYERYRYSYEVTLKDGTTKQRERWEERPVSFPRLVKPAKGTETKPTCDWGDDELARINWERAGNGQKPFTRHWSVSEPVLKTLKLNKKPAKIVELMLRRSYLDKLDSTYYTGLVEKMHEVEAIDGRIHGRFNQCVARTGRLSSSDPNLQNFSGDIKCLFTTRFV